MKQISLCAFKNLPPLAQEQFVGCERLINGKFKNKVRSEAVRSENIGSNVSGMIMNNKKVIISVILVVVVIAAIGFGIFKAGILQIGGDL